MWTQETLHIFQGKTKHNTIQILSVFTTLSATLRETMFTSIYTHHYWESIPKPRPLLNASCYVCFSLDRGRSIHRNIQIAHCFAHAQFYGFSVLLITLIFEWNFEFIRIFNWIQTRFVVRLKDSQSQSTNQQQNKTKQAPCCIRKIRNRVDQSVKEQSEQLNLFLSPNNRIYTQNLFSWLVKYHELFSFRENVSRLYSLYVVPSTVMERIFTDPWKEILQVISNNFVVSFSPWCFVRVWILHSHYWL